MAKSSGSGGRAASARRSIARRVISRGTVNASSIASGGYAVTGNGRVWRRTDYGSFRAVGQSGLSRNTVNIGPRTQVFRLNENELDAFVATR